jgi:hypothetical protein
VPAPALLPHPVGTEHARDGGEALGGVALEHGRRVPPPVVAVGVGHVAAPERRHGPALPRVHRREASRVARGGDNGVVDGAALHDEVGELGHERRVIVVGAVPPAQRGPGGAVPDGGVQRHGLRRERRAHGRSPHHLPDRGRVHVESAVTGIHSSTSVQFF